MTADAQLLRQYVECRSETAFAGVVQRHLALVYHAAVRELGGDSQLAEDVLRAERRRRTREAAAHFIHELMQNELSAGDWERLRPMVDEVLLELKESDREALLLRIFEGRPFNGIAARLRLTENTAHKRVARALETGF